MGFLFEIERVSEEPRREGPGVVRPMRLTRRPHDAAEMRCLGPLAGELGAIALGSRPLVAERIGSRWLAIRSEQVDKSEHQKSPLTQTDVWGGGRLIGHSLQEDGMGEA